MATATRIDTDSLQLVVFELDGDLYGVPIDQVQEIIRYSDPRQVASDAPWVRGVINLRGKIVAVCDLAARLRLHDHQQAEESNIVIVETGDGTAGVIVDRVDEVVTVAADQIDPAVGSSDSALTGIAKTGDKLVVILDPAALFAGLDLGE